jgi:hypothetical protein
LVANIRLTEKELDRGVDLLVEIDPAPASELAPVSREKLGEALDIPVERGLDSLRITEAKASLGECIEP